MQLGNGNGKLGRGKYELTRSTYKTFLMTTDEGRVTSGTREKIVEGSYDQVFTSETPRELRNHQQEVDYGRNNIYKQIKVLDPQFYKTLQGLDLSKDEDANVVIAYFKSKVNNPVPKEKLLDAIINVKKTVYVNFNEQDFEDMKMGYSLFSPFSIKTENLWESDKSLYGKKYDEYLERRYDDIKSETQEQAKKNNPLLLVNEVIKHKRNVLLSDDKIFSGEMDGNFFTVNDKKYIDLIRQNSDKVASLGIEIEYDDELEDLKLKFPKNQENDTIEVQMEKLAQHKKNLYIALGLEKEKSQTQKLGEETLQEQNDTKGKMDIQNDMNRQLNEMVKSQEDQIIQ